MCVYETKRSKPGLKAGALESVHRRLGTQAKMPYQQEGRTDTFHPPKMP